MDSFLSFVIVGQTRRAMSEKLYVIGTLDLDNRDPYFLVCLTWH